MDKARSLQANLDNAYKLVYSVLYGTCTWQQSVSFSIHACILRNFPLSMGVQPTFLHLMYENVCLHVCMYVCMYNYVAR